MTEVSKTLEERGARYGKFEHHAEIAQGLQEVLQEAPNYWRLKADVRQMMIVITDKLARILNGDPDYTDNYHDIQGYAKLVEDRLIREEKEKSPQNAKLFETPSTISHPPMQPPTMLFNNGDMEDKFAVGDIKRDDSYYEVNRNR